MLDKRLSLCAEMVTGDRICDVGTDHGYLPCELVASGKCRLAAACDVREKPLLSAKKNIEKYGLSDRIRTILSDGLDNVDTSEFTDIVMAGMGGGLIADILGRAIIGDSVNLVLQPMTKAELLRKFLCENGYEIKNEKVIRDRHFFYTAIQAVKNGRAVPADDVSVMIGFMDHSAGDGREYALYKYRKLMKAAKGARSSDEEKSKRLLSLALRIEERINGKEETI